MELKEKIALQMGMLLLANMELAAKVEELQARLAAKEKPESIEVPLDE